jgi:hypothetical protein
MSKVLVKTFRAGDLRGIDPKPAETGRVANHSDDADSPSFAAQHAREDRCS